MSPSTEDSAEPAFPSVETLPFGNTGHASTRIIFGAAALGAMSEERAARTMDLFIERGINHIDTAAIYGESEVRLAPFLAQHRQEVFLATKTGNRDRQSAWDSIERSLERLGIDQIDLIQLHNLVDLKEWEEAMGPGGALEACLEARDRGLVRFIGVTGHGTRVAERHIQSLERFPFDSVLLPYNWTMMEDPQYAADFERLYGICRERRVAMQTIKSIARRRWPDSAGEKRFSWYEPIRDPEVIAQAVRWVLHREGVFLNTSSDATLLTATLDAAAAETTVPSRDEIATHIAELELQPLFVRGKREGVA